jgi:hypothetical protein
MATAMAQQPAERVYGRPFKKGQNSRELFKLRVAAIFEALEADFPNLSSGEQVQLRTAASLIARSEAAACGNDQAIRCAATANRIVSSLRRHAPPVRTAGLTLADLLREDRDDQNSNVVEADGDLENDVGGSCGDTATDLLDHDENAQAATAESAGGIFDDGEDEQ